MKKIFRLSALFCAMTLLVTSCSKDETLTEQPIIDPTLAGSEIQFGARAGFENADDSRTVYGPQYTENGVTYQRIDWVDDVDMVEIMCAEAGNGPRAHYLVKNQKDATEKNDYGYLAKTTTSALQWGAGPHTFYAMYPSSETFVNTEKAYVYINEDDKTMHGLIPNEQHSPEMQAFDANGNKVSLDAENISYYEAMPDMRYAYMVAKTAVENPTTSVSFTFKPVVTAVRFSLKLPTGTDVIDKYVSAVQVSGPGIAGQFTADLGNWNNTPYPTISTPTTDEQSIKTVFDEPVLLKAGQSIYFTMFLHPGANIDASTLTLSFSQTGGDWKSKKIGANSGTVVIPALKKSSLTGIQLPADRIELGYENWMYQIKDNTPVKGLSLPGTGGSFSANGADGYNQQTLPYLASTSTQTSQWDLGVRAFEIVCERPNSSSTSLGDEYVKCNGSSVGIRVYTVITDLIKKVQSIVDNDGNPTETAMVILTYQPEGSGRDRNAEAFAGSLATMLTAGTSAQYRLTQDEINCLVVYSPTLTLGEARGKVMIVARVNQQNEAENNTDWNTAFTKAKTALGDKPVLLVNGCGTSKDRWGARGYKVNGNDAWHQPASAIVHSPSADVANYSVEHYLIQDSNGTFPDWNLVTVPDETTTLKFNFGTNNDSFDIIYQEWARVVDYSHLGVTNGGPFITPQVCLGHSGTWLFGYTGTVNRICRWYSSFDEKLSNATRIFNQAITDTSGQHVYINSLCGYLVDASITASMQPYTAAPMYSGGAFTGSTTAGGIAGNIKALADKINPLFGAHVRGAITGDEGTGPTGVIMMDFVSDNPSDGASYYLPGLIISNNIYSGNVDSSKEPVKNPEGGETEEPEQGL